LLRYRFGKLIAGVRGELLDGDGDPIEKFLIHRIVASHLEVVIRMNEAAEPISDVPLERREHFLRRRTKSVAAFREYEIVRLHVGSQL
jgi:hypothetical protein